MKTESIGLLLQEDTRSMNLSTHRTAATAMAEMGRQVAMVGNVT
jgi:tRNA(Leu) C34 or U34 (ribose-2'-O)-methylase TrmL